MMVCDAEISETLDEVLVSTTFVQSWLVSVSTTAEIPSLQPTHPPPTHHPGKVFLLAAMEAKALLAQASPSLQEVSEESASS